MSLAYLGPVAINFHGNPKFSWNSDPLPNGMRAASIGGLLDWPEAQQLSELVDNFHRRVPYRGEVGVLEEIFFTDELLSPFNGWYLFQSYNLDPDQSHSLGGNGCPFTLNAMYLGAVQPVVTRSSRARTNSHSITGKSFVADPFFGGGFVSSPGGTLVEREYDPDPYDASRVLAEAASMDVYLNPTSEVIPLT